MPTMVDLGCGPRRKEGCIGVDFVAGAGVDHVVDIAREKVPFEDGSVDHVFSSHFLEHVAEPGRVLREILRICRPDATVEIWTPHARSDLAFLPGHVTYFSETLWQHLCVKYPEIWFLQAEGVLRLDEIHFVLSPGIERTIGTIPLWFAIRHFHNIVLEMKASLRALKGPQYRDKTEFKRDVRPPELFVGYERSDRRPLPAPSDFLKVPG